MFKKITAVYPLDNMQLLVWFVEGEAKTYDVAPLLKQIDAFKPLNDPQLFKSVKVDAGGYGISWTDDIDLAGNELYANGTPVDVVTDEKARVVAEVAAARKSAGFSQTAAEEASGVRQPVIARMESGDTAPQLDTIIRVLAPLGKTLKVVDMPESIDYALVEL